MWAVLAHLARRSEPLTVDLAGAINRAARGLPAFANDWAWAQLAERERRLLYEAADCAHRTHAKDGDLAERMERESFNNKVARDAVPHLRPLGGHAG